jgi:hypothetical protein
MKAAKDANIADRSEARDVSILVDDMAKSNPAAAAGLAKAIKKNGDVKLTASGKSESVKEIVHEIAAEVEKQHMASGSQEMKDATLVTQFVALAGESVSNPTGLDRQVVAKEAQLSSKIMSKSWDGKPRTSHITLIKDMVRKLKTKTVVALDAALGKVMSERYGNKSEAKEKEIVDCTL